MALDDTKVGTPAGDEAQAQADFESGMPDAGKVAKVEPKADTKPDPKADPKPAAKAAEPVAIKASPEYVRVTKEQFDTWNAAAAKTASYETQLSKAFGTIGNLQKALTTLQAGTPRGFKVEIPKDAFAAMEKDFPELAQHSRAALEATLRGLTGTGPAGAEIDPDMMKRLVAEHAAQVRTDAEIEALEDEYPDWRTIVGQVDISKQQPDPNNAYRKWLAKQPVDYQARLNGTNSAAVISRSISKFRADTKAAPAPAPSLKALAQAARIKDAIQPRGDGGQAAPARSDDDEFVAGFAAR